MTPSTTTQNPLGLPDAYQPAAFSPTQTSGLATGSPELRHTMHICRMYHGIMTNAEHTAREAARVHLMATLNLACLLRDLQQQARLNRIPAVALYKGNKCTPEDQARAAEITGGTLLPFTYKTSRTYIKVLEGVEDRMQKGGMTPAECVQVLREHAAALMDGRYDNPGEATEQLWSPWVTDTSISAALRSMAPALPPALPEPPPADTTPAPMPWEERRAKTAAQFMGVRRNLDTFIEHMACFATQADREAQACELEDAARRLRSIKTRRSETSNASTEL